MRRKTRLLVVLYKCIAPIVVRVLGVGTHMERLAAESSFSFSEFLPETIGRKKTLQVADYVTRDPDSMFLRRDKA